MENQTAKIVAAILGVVGIVLILAGPAFHLVESTPALFAGIVCFVVAGAIKEFFKKTKNVEMATGEAKNVEMATGEVKQKRDKKFFDGLFWAGFLILVGLVFGADYMGISLPELGGGESWQWIFLGAGVYGLALSIIRVSSPKYPNPNTLDYIGVGVLFLIGFSGMISFDSTWPIILILVGVVIIGSLFMKKD
jgi:hypothetical protein